jgi:hypothetical protein
MQQKGEIGSGLGCQAVVLETHVFTQRLPLINSGKASGRVRKIYLLWMKSGKPVGKPCGKPRGRGLIRPSGFPSGLSMGQAKHAGRSARRIIHIGACRLPI